jgi:hypothetical protein
MNGSDELKNGQIMQAAQVRCNAHPTTYITRQDITVSSKKIGRRHVAPIPDKTMAVVSLGKEWEKCLGEQVEPDMRRQGRTNIQLVRKTSFR